MSQDPTTWILPPAPLSETHTSFCRICEALCGVLVEVEAGAVVRVRGDADHPVSKGYICPKGASMGKVIADPDRVRWPLRRTGGPGEFERVTWDEALDDIASRLGNLRTNHGPHSIGFYLGNPSAFSMSHMFWAKGFCDAIGTRNFFSVGAQDTFGRQAASWSLYGSPVLFPIPDIPRTDFVLIVGANPLVSHGSLLTLPRIADHLRDVVRRGGQVVVVDPARTKTARAFEHIPIRPGADVWLLGGMVRELFATGVVDRAHLGQIATGASELEAAVEHMRLEQVEANTRIPARTVADLAARFASANRATAYGRVGIGRGRYATTVNMLVDALAVLTGNLDVVGGSMFGTGPVDLAAMASKFDLASMGTRRSRVGDLPDISGHLPWVLPDEIATTGQDQVRALFVTAGNPVLSAPESDRFAAQLPNLDLVVSIDLYVNETNRHAHYILPSLASLERWDLPITFLAHMPIPFIQSTEPVVAPPEDVREEWEIFDELAARMGLGGPFNQRSARVIARALRAFGRRITPQLVISLLFRVSRSGWSPKRISRHVHGVVTASGMTPNRAHEAISHPDGRVHLADPAILEQLRTCEPTSTELLLIGRRSLRAINSWFHNVAKRPSEPALWIHPDDAATHGLVDGGRALLSTGTGEIDVLVQVTDDVQPGTVSYPHGYGHDAGWKQANAHGGANVNILASASLADKDPISGATVLEGIPVQISGVPDRSLPAETSA